MESSSSAQSKPVVVRVKRRLCHPPLDALWLEINDRPLKQACLDFSKLAVSETSQTDVSDKVPTKILVQHIDTVDVDDAEAAKEAVQSFIGSSSEARNNSRKRLVEERNSMKQCKSLQGQLRRLTSRRKHDETLKNTRFQQLWNRRNRNDEASDGDFFQELCRLYDVVRVDENIEESSSVPHEHGNGSLDGYEDILCNFLPLIREHIPEAVAEIESDISASKRSGDGYVYDLYTMGNEMPTIVGDAFDKYPLVQLQAEDDFYDGPEKNEYDSPDSNDEDNPLNDYPDEDDLSSSENEESHSGSSQGTDNESNLYEKYMDEVEEDYHEHNRSVHRVW